VVEVLSGVVAEATNSDQDLVILVAQDSAEIVGVCAAVRERFRNPVLVVYTGEKSDVATAMLDAGADDVMVPSVSESEFLARVDVALRYRGALTALASDDVLEVGALRIDRTRRVAVIDGESIELSPNEFSLLSTLARAVGHAVPADVIAAQIWPGKTEANPNRLRICATRLRKMLAGRTGAPLIIAERGVGYMMVLASPEP
jgi:two-component system KDP operon response regulator KdpE